MSSGHQSHSSSNGVNIRLATLSDADYAARYAVMRACDPTTTIDKMKYADAGWDAKYQHPDESSLYL